MMNKRIWYILALLFVGSASMLAEEADPFPEVPYGYWQGNMTLTAKVMLDGVELDNTAIVAAYNGTEIRGKQRINKNKILSLTIAGNSGEYPPIHFKVYTGGRIIEVDQGLTYTYYANIGSYEDPYIIDLPLVTTTTSSEGWGTTCLPYNAAMPEGVTVYTATEISGGVLKMQKVEATILPKNTPVLLKASEQKSVEWLSRVADSDATIGTNLFKGTTEATTVEAESVLTLGHATDGNKTIGFWLYTGTSIPAYKAYIEKNDAAGARGLTLNWQDEATGISAALNDKGERRKEKCYDLQGRRVTNVQSSMFNGQIRIMNGKKYLVR